MNHSGRQGRAVSALKLVSCELLVRREVETRFRFVDLTLVNYRASPLQLSHALQGFALKDLETSTTYIVSAELGF